MIDPSKVDALIQQLINILDPEGAGPAIAWERMRAAVLRWAQELSATQVWCCFHCDDVFTDQAAARDHFGPTQISDPACRIDIAEYRRMEELNRRNCEEDTDLHRALAAQSAEMASAVRRAEEQGYTRGLEDAKKHPEELGLRPNMSCDGPPPRDENETPNEYRRRLDLLGYGSAPPPPKHATDCQCLDCCRFRKHPQLRPRNPPPEPKPLQCDVNGHKNCIKSSPDCHIAGECTAEPKTAHCTCSKGSLIDSTWDHAIGCPLRAAPPPAKPDEGHVVELVQALNEACSACACTVRERDSGHRTDCYVPQWRELLERVGQSHPSRLEFYAVVTEKSPSGEESPWIASALMATHEEAAQEAGCEAIGQQSGPASPASRC